MAFEIAFLPVGNSNGDAICIRYGNDQTGYYGHEVDGGFSDTGQTGIDHIERYYHGRQTKIANMEALMNAAPTPRTLRAIKAE